MIAILRRKLNNLTADKKFSEILTGSVWALSARVLATGLGLISSIIIARFYGAEVMGILAILNSFLLLATIFTVLGTNTSILRLIPEHLVKYSPTSAFNLYRKVQYLVIGVSLIIGTLCFFSSHFIANKVFFKPHLSFYFALAAMFVVFKSLMLLNTEAVRGLRLIRTFAFMQVLPSASNLVFLIFLTVFLYSKNNPIYAMLMKIAATGILGWIIMTYAFRKRTQPQDPVQPMPVRQILSISMPMLMTKSMTFVIGQTGVIFLGIFRSEAEVGCYSVAVTLAGLTAFILSSINTMIAPKFSELFHSDRIEEVFYVAKKSSKLIFWTTTPILAGFIVLGKPVLSLFYGQEFAVAYPALVLLVFGQFINSISGSTGTFLNMTGKQNVLRNIMVISAMTNIALNMLLVPKIGIYGSAIAAMVSRSSWNIAALIYIKSKHGKTTGYFPLISF